MKAGPYDRLELASNIYAMGRLSSRKPNVLRQICMLLLGTGAFLPTYLTGVFYHPSGLHSEAPARFQYVDVTKASGVTYYQSNSATPSKYLIETMGGGVALFDYDNDGWLDIYFVNGAKLHNAQKDGEALDKSSPEFWNRLYHNNRDGTYSDVTEKADLKGTGYGMGTATGDFDGDGFVDLLVTTYGGAFLYRNNGDGTFSDVTAKSGLKTEGWTTSAGFLDFNRDGRLDLFICRYVKWDFAAGSRFCGVEGPNGRSYCHPNEFKPVSNYLFKNNGDSTFTDVSSPSGIAASEGKSLGMAFQDFDKDGFLDISVANDSFPQFLFRNKGDGTFAEVGYLAGVGYTEDGQTFAGMGTDFADLDDDGYPDIITTALPYEYYAFFRNNGDGTFNYASVTSDLAGITRLLGGWGMRVFDYDNDGMKDVFIANSHVMDNISLTQPQISYPQKLILLRFSRGKFKDISSEAGDAFQEFWPSRGAAFGDLDNDGDIDIVVTTLNGPAHILRNEGGSLNNWIGLDLRSWGGNRYGLGAYISLTSASGHVQHAIASTAGSYQSANDRRVFFGLGNERAIKEVHIAWPDGAEQIVKDPSINRILVVGRPSPPAVAPAISATGQ